MFEKLNSKDVRALKLGAAGIAVTIFIFVFIDFQEHWTKVNTSFEAANTKLTTLAAAINLTEAKYAKLKSQVPVFKMPVEKGKQKFLFQDSLNEQFKKAGINSLPWEEIADKSKLLGDHELLRLKTSGKCSITQLFDLLANLNENPYLMSVEELLIKIDPQNKQQAEFEITLSTPLESSKG
jgi:hypothetical protein